MTVSQFELRQKGSEIGATRSAQERYHGRVRRIGNVVSLHKPSS